MGPNPTVILAVMFVAPALCACTAIASFAFTGHPWLALAAFAVGIIATPREFKWNRKGE